MAKYTAKEKEAIVSDKINNNLTFAQLSAKYGVADNNLRKWARMRELYGDGAFTMPAPDATPEFRVGAVMSYFDGCSENEVSARYRISHTTLRNWAKFARENGISALSDMKK